MDTRLVKPFLKWPGGKRWLVDNYYKLIPAEIGVYHEPFAGSAALYFSIECEKAILSDINGWLIDTYLAIKDDWKSVETELKVHRRNHSKEYYYKIRSRICRAPHTRAAQLIYLNRTCWNGLFRLNKAGKFNVPIGDRSTIVYETDNFERISRKLSNTRLYTQDFSETIDMAESGDFVYLDPPYTVKHNLNGFIRYNESLFSWESQIRLRDCVKDAIERGVKVLISNAKHESVLELYSNLGEIYQLERNNMLSSDARFRGIYEEIAIVCGYDVQDW